MRKIVALIFPVLLFGGVVKAQTVESKFGVDSVKTIEHASVFQEFVKQKIIKTHCQVGGMCFIMHRSSS